MFYTTIVLLYIALGIIEGITLIRLFGGAMSTRHKVFTVMAITIFWPAYIILSMGYTYSSDIRSTILAYLQYLDRGY